MIQKDNIINLYERYPSKFNQYEAEKDINISIYDYFLSLDISEQDKILYNILKDIILDFIDLVFRESDIQL